jgi:hypothetical protein
MRATVLRAPGGYDGIENRDIPDPGPPHTGEIRVALHASSLNYHDLLVAKGSIPRADGRVLMSDGAGVVEASGGGVAESKPGRKVISKEDLLNAVWGDTAVTEGSLTRCIWLLRRMLGDDVNEPRFIETVATVGYRLVCKVEVSAASRQELEEAPAFSRTGFSVSDNGVTVFQSATESASRLAWFDRSGKELEELPRTGYRDPALSRDGALLAVSSDDDHNGKHYIHIYDLARGTSTRVSDEGSEIFPVLSPDGKRVAYEVNNARTSQSTDVAATDGSGKLERLAASRFVIPNDWSVNGRFLVYMNFQNSIAPELDVLDIRNHSRQPTQLVQRKHSFLPMGDGSPSPNLDQGAALERVMKCT